MQDDIIDGLEKLVIDNPTFDEIVGWFNCFCPFEALGVVRHEIRHSNFLAYCMDPNRPHGFGEECLKGAMRAVARAYRRWPSVLNERAITPLDFHLMDFERARVFREWKGVDLLVLLPDHKMVIAFELKIDAKEHSQQLRRYRASVNDQYPGRDGWNQILVFLTKRGTEPSDTGEGWFALGLEDVAKEMDRVVETGVGEEFARNQLSSYVTMLRRHHLPNERLDELAAKLWSQHREALAFLMERSPQGGAGIYGRLFEEKAALASKISEAAGLPVVLDDCTRTNIRFAVPRWDKVRNMCTAVDWTASNRILLLELAASNDRKSISMRLVIGQGDRTVRQQIYAVLERAGLKSGRKQITDTWTRIATEVTKLDENEEDVDLSYEKVIEKIMGYCTRVLPKADAALMTTGP
ncbi:MAG: PD-(D/E)XK nuclease family protein [Sphingomicrobium sp.]